MSRMDWAFLLLIAGVLCGDAIRAQVRDWRARRWAIKHGRTLTSKFGLPLV